MSFARNRGLFGEPLEGVGVLGCRPLGCEGPAVWLPCFFPGDSPSFQCPHSPSRLISVFPQGIDSECCGSGSLREGGNRTCSSFSRLLQTPVCYPQSHWGLAASDRPLLSQPLCSNLPFPYGGSAVGPPVSASRGLDGISRSARRLPSGSCPSGVSFTRGSASGKRSSSFVLFASAFRLLRKRSLASWPQFRRLCIVMGSRS